MANISINIDGGSVTSLLSEDIAAEANDDVKLFAEMCLDAIVLYTKKNHDYGNSFNKGMEAIGNAYGVGRIFDKVNRLVTLCNKEDEAQVNESYNDTLMDLACYSLMTLAYRKKAQVDKINNIKFD